MQTIANIVQEQAWNGRIGQHWADHAGNYDGLVRDFDAALFEAAAIGPEDDVLDIGCGTGGTTLHAARQAGWGQVLGIDLSRPMLECARAAAVAEAATNVRFVQGDAQVHPFSVAAFDVAISRGGVMFFADHTEAFTNIRHALRPGGRLAFVAPTPPDPQSPSARLYALLGALPRAESAGAVAGQAMTSFADPDRIREVLGAGGFGSVSVERREGRIGWGRDAAEATEFFLSSAALRLDLAAARPAALERTRADIRAALAEWETPAGVRLPGSVWLVKGVAEATA
ncbi:class I SAM-dependent methyltransferase [Flindersiella endophytica]